MKFIMYSNDTLDGGTHEDARGVEDIQDSVNESTPSTQGIMCVLVCYVSYMNIIPIVSTSQVIIPCPSDRYTGQVYYERIGYNRWLMNFIVIRDIDAYMMVRLYNIHLVIIIYYYNYNFIVYII